MARKRINKSKSPKEISKRSAVAAHGKKSKKKVPTPKRGAYHTDMNNVR